MDISRTVGRDVLQDPLCSARLEGEGGGAGETLATGLTQQGIALLCDLSVLANSGKSGNEPALTGRQPR